MTALKRMTALATCHSAKSTFYVVSPNLFVQYFIKLYTNSRTTLSHYLSDVVVTSNRIQAISHTPDSIGSGCSTGSELL